MAKTTHTPSGKPAGQPPVRLSAHSIVKQYDHELTGARLLLLEAGAQGRTRRYIVGWAGDWQRTMRTYRAYPSLDKARVYFNRKARQDPPYTSALCRDWQRNKVYRWEEDTLDKAELALDAGQMRNVIRRISTDFNLAAQPTLKLKNKEENYSYYDGLKNEIGMGHRSLSALLHELAHAIDMQMNQNFWAGHGPSFMRTLIMLAAHYQYWQDEQELEDSARKAGIKIAPRDAVAQPLPR